MSGLGPGCVKTPTPNLRVEILISIRLIMRKRARTATFERSKRRKQFCASSACARFHTWVIFGRRDLAADVCFAPISGHGRAPVRRPLSNILEVAQAVAAAERLERGRWG